VILRQFLHRDPVAASYLLGCGDKALAAVVDPGGDVAPCLKMAEANGVQMLFVIKTHQHADNLSAGRALALFARAQRRKALPESYSGSVCGRSLSGKPTLTIGFERRFNTACRIEDEADFIPAMTKDVPPPPPEAARNRAVSAGMAA